MIEKFDVTLTPFNCERTIHVYLPEGYEESEERYPVVYMYDGHNLYSDEDATYGKSWGLKDFLDSYDKKLIIVGMESSKTRRMNEYTPYDFENYYFGSVKGEGELYMDWVIDELKPLIDKKYRTYPFRECTAIAGSSMGGLMAFYTVVKYNQYFSKAAAVSPALFLCEKDLKKEWDKTDFFADTRIYFSMGENEVDNMEWAMKDIWYFNDKLVALGGHSYVYFQKDGHHCEASWEEQNPIYMDFLWK